MSKTLTIKHDGQLVVSGYGTLLLGETPLHSVLVHALKLNENDREEYNVDLELTIHFKNSYPEVRWSGEC